MRVPLTMMNCTMKFMETGLTAGTEWCVTFSGTTSCSTTSTISFSGIPNGSYHHSVKHLSYYNLTRHYSGTVTVVGGGPGSVARTVNLAWKL